MATISEATYTRRNERQTIDNQYIVLFKSGTTSAARAAHRSWAAEKHFNLLATDGHGSGTSGLLSKFNICDGAVTGYCARIPPSLKDEIAQADEVDLVEQDMKVYATELVTQEGNLSWGLARLSNADTLTEETRKKYTYDSSAGEGVTAYIIDTGILAKHEEFEGRATFGYNSVRKSTNTDLNGHGTHVAGTIGSKTYGVAKKVHLIGVKVLGDDGSGTNTTVIQGIEWALADAKKRGVKKCVANMSLGGGRSEALNRTVKAAISQGFTIVVAAGNEGEDATNSSPASERTAITVGATDINDNVTSWSNYGEYVDIFAPGHNITSTWIDETGGEARNKIRTISGTSMASPHVCGLVAYLIAKDPSLDTPAKVVQKLKELGVKDKINKASLENKPQSVNLLAQNGAYAATKVVVSK